MALRLGKDGKLLLSEAEVTKQIIQFLRARDWVCLRLQSGLVRGFTGKSIIRLNEPGVTDWIAVRGLPLAVLFLEVKRSKGGRLSADQIRWQDNIRRQGLDCQVVDDYDKFLAYYAEFLAA